MALRALGPPRFLVALAPGAETALPMVWGAERLGWDPCSLEPGVPVPVQALAPGDYALSVRVPLADREVQASARVRVADDAPAPSSSPDVDLHPAPGDAGR